MKLVYIYVYKYKQSLQPYDAFMGHKRLTVNSTVGRVPYPLWGINDYLNKQRTKHTLLNSATQHAMSQKFGEKWGKECLNIRVPLPTLLYAGYMIAVKIGL